MLGDEPWEVRLLGLAVYDSLPADPNSPAPRQLLMMNNRPFVNSPPQ